MVVAVCMAVSPPWLSESESDREQRLSEDLTPDENLTLKQKRFADEFVKTGNAKVAAREAGYGGSDHTLEQIGYVNLRKVEVRRWIDARLYSAELLKEEEARGTPCWF